MKRMLLSVTAVIALLMVLIQAPDWKAGASECGSTSVGLTPLTELGPGFYQGFEGGLFPGGTNLRPSAHEDAGLAIARGIRPRKGNGKISTKKGKIVLLSIGMSNTTMEFSTFKSMADSDPVRNRKLVIVDGAQGGMTASEVSDPSSSQGQRFWETVDQRLSQAGVTASQVQIAWVKEANARPSESFPAHAVALQSQLEQIALVLKQRFPNIRIAYYSSRIYAGYASTSLNPEPFAYESAFSVKWMVEKQISGSPDLNFDSVKGDIKSPWLSWGPYLWADGMNPRADGLSWPCSDYNSDGTHPAPSGREKVAELLLDFFKTDSTAASWFLE